MGDSHYKSNIVAKAGTETISGFASVGGTAVTGTTVTATGAVTGATVVATSYVKIGSIYILSGTVPTNSSASILAAAVALVSAPVPKGTLFINASPGALWQFTATMTAATLA